jgi:hypothetical protein
MSALNEPFRRRLHISTGRKMPNAYPFPYLPHLHPHETFLVFDQTFQAHFGPYAGVFDGMTLFDDEPNHNFFHHLDNLLIQLYLFLFNLKSSLPDDIPLV